MYNLGQNLLAGSSNGVAGSTLLIPTQFVWPHGGREVFISGSFTRWSEPIRMSPVDGCPTAFQIIYNITPGYHQYKFLVDGEWRHDECQPHGTGEYGVVNIILLTKEPDLSPAMVVPEAPGFRSLMDVDNDAFRGVARLSNDLKVSRDRISAYLSHHTAYELLPESGKVIALDVTLPVKQAFHILYEQGIPLAPLWDFSKGQFTGVLSPLDFILILGELANHRSNLTEEELERHTISAWKKDKLQLNRQISQNSEVLPRPLVHAGSTVSLKDLSLKFLQNGVSTVPIIESASQLAHLASLSDILKCIWRHFRSSFSLLPILQQPICLIPLGTWDPKFGKNQRPLATLGPNEPLSVALSLLIQAQVSSIPIVDNCGSLLYIYSRSDITALAKDEAYAQIHIDQISIHQALQLGQYPNSPYGQHYQLCLRSDSLHKVIEKMIVPGVRRVIIVEAGTNRVEGIISLTDVFRFLLG